MSTQPPEQPSEHPSEQPSESRGASRENGNGALVSPKIRNGMAVVITAVWALTFIASIFVKDFTPNPFVHMMMLGLAAAIFGSGFAKGIK